MEAARAFAQRCEHPRNLSQDLISRDWQEYADSCFCHDKTEPVVSHARELAHHDELAMTVSTT